MNPNLFCNTLHFKKLTEATRNNNTNPVVSRLIDDVLFADDMNIASLVMKSSRTGSTRRGTRQVEQVPKTYEEVVAEWFTIFSKKFDEDLEKYKLEFFEKLKEQLLDQDTKVGMAFTEYANGGEEGLPEQDLYNEKTALSDAITGMWLE